MNYVRLTMIALMIGSPAFARDYVELRGHEASQIMNSLDSIQLSRSLTNLGIGQNLEAVNCVKCPEANSDSQFTYSCSGAYFDENIEAVFDLQSLGEPSSYSARLFKTLRHMRLSVKTYPNGCKAVGAMRMECSQPLEGWSEDSEKKKQADKLAYCIVYK